LVEDLYKFLEIAELPLVKDGGFLAWKRVNSDYKSIYNGNVTYKVGTTVSEPWESVSKSRNECGGMGLYFGSRIYFDKLESQGETRYGDNGGNRLLLVKVMPRDVASVPISYGHSKGRACKLFVYAEYDNNSDINLKKSVINSKNGPTRDKFGRFARRN
jgi:hypothetical protein